MRSNSKRLSTILEEHDSFSRVTGFEIESKIDLMRTTSESETSPMNKKKSNQSKTEKPKQNGPHDPADYYDEEDFSDLWFKMNLLNSYRAS